jgi:hypothetical protein
MGRRNNRRGKQNNKKSTDPVNVITPPQQINHKINHEIIPIKKIEIIENYIETLPTITENVTNVPVNYAGCTIF